jgi:hypothetical protein
MVDFLPVILSTGGTVVGIVIGVAISETMRRRNRRELYAPLIFEKRLAAYEGLIERIQKGSDIASEVIKNTELTQDQRHELISVAIQSLAKFADSNRLYIDEELTLHCTALFMGVEDIQDAGTEKDEMLNLFYEMRKEALRMISEDSGVAEINRLFKSINKPKIDGELIRYFRKVKNDGAKGL